PTQIHAEPENHRDRTTRSLPAKPSAVPLRSSLPHFIAVRPFHQIGVRSGDLRTEFPALPRSEEPSIRRRRLPGHGVRPLPNVDSVSLGGMRYGRSPSVSVREASDPAALPRHGEFSSRSSVCCWI